MIRKAVGKLSGNCRTILGLTGIVSLLIGASTAPGFAAQDLNYWSGTWRTPFNQITWRWLPSNDGRRTLASLQPASGAGLRAVCGSNPLYFDGNYRNNDGQTGVHAACTNGKAILGRYRDADGDAGWYRAVIDSGDNCVWHGVFRPDGTSTDLAWSGNYVGRARGDGGPNVCAGGRAFSVSTYANDVRVRPPLVGWYQLCLSRLNGSGWYGPSGAVAFGTFTQSISCPSRPGGPRDSDHSISHEIINGTVTVKTSPAGPVRTLQGQIRVTSSRRPDLCPVGQVGNLTLRDSPQRIANGQNADFAQTLWPGDPCPDQGWDNRDAPAAEPTKGGPPDGGHWAIVKIR